MSWIGTPNNQAISVKIYISKDDREKLQTVLINLPVKIGIFRRKDIVEYVLEDVLDQLDKQLYYDNSEE